jgi:2-polyprenyl-6-methoxyphenol hydroxylase-like FAD-dependent oxidoreductase
MTLSAPSAWDEEIEVLVIGGGPGGSTTAGRLAQRGRKALVLEQARFPRFHSTHRVMTPIEFLARLATLLAPPNYPLVRYHGVLAPHAKRLRAVVPKPPSGARPHAHPTPQAHDFVPIWRYSSKYARGLGLVG